MLNNFAISFCSFTTLHRAILVSTLSLVTVSLTFQQISTLHKFIRKSICIILCVGYDNNGQTHFNRYAYIVKRRIPISSLGLYKAFILLNETKKYRLDLYDSVIVEENMIYHEILALAFQQNIQEFGKLWYFLVSENDITLKLCVHLTLNKRIIRLIKHFGSKRLIILEQVLRRVDSQQSFDYNLCYKIESFIDPTESLKSLGIKYDYSLTLPKK